MGRLNDLYAVRQELLLRGIKGFEPVVSDSVIWLNWLAEITLTTCALCKKAHGVVFLKSEDPMERFGMRSKC